MEATSANPTELLNGGYDTVLVIPQGFSENLSKGRPGRVDLYVKVKGLSLTFSARTEGISSALRVALGKALSEVLGIPQTLFLSPLSVNSYVLVPSIGLLPPQEASSLLWLPLSVGMILLILAMVVAQISALSMS